MLVCDRVFEVDPLDSTDEAIFYVLDPSRFMIKFCLVPLIFSPLELALGDG